MKAAWAVVVAGLFAIAVAAPVKLISKHAGHSSPRGSGGASASTTVHMAGLKFSPSALVVPKGAVAVFDNNDVAPHTVTEDTPGGVDSGVLPPSKAFRLVISRRLVYHCTIHPSMKATVNLAG